MKKLITLSSILFPSLALAQIKDVNDVTNTFTNLGNTFIQILISFAVIYIIFYVVVYFVVGGSEEGKRKSAGMNIFWGIVGLFVILSIWGLVNILTGSFRTNNIVPNATQIPHNNYPSQIPL